MSRVHWILLSKTLVNAGFIAFASCFIALSALSQYVAFTRPHTADPNRNWIVTIPWSHGAYGTSQERQRVLLCFNCGFYSFGLIAAGEAINIYKLDVYRKQRP
jgi:hypothetical protein